MSDANTSGDSTDLEALFDSIASGVARAAPAAAPAAAPPVAAPAPAPAPAAAPRTSLLSQALEGDGSSEDSQDLQALFDSIVAKKAVASAASAGGEEWPAQDKVFQQVGQMVRQLHDTLGSLGFDKLIEARLLIAPPEARADLDLAKGIVQGYTRRLARYRCDNCGFKARQFYWRCPACGGWETYSPKRTEEFDLTP